MGDNLKLLGTDFKYKIKFTKVTTELLGDGYNTNCFEYDLDYKFANFNMRSDCITSCIRKNIRNECNLNGLMIYDGLLRHELLKNLGSIHYNYENLECQSTIFEFSKIKCRELCKKDCTFRYFPSTYQIWPNDDLKFHLMIQFNQMPDTYIKYLPQTTFLSLVCNFGGLLGMWLGLSFLNILECFSKICKQKLQRIFIIHRPCLTIDVFRLRRIRHTNN